MSYSRLAFDWSAWPYGQEGPDEITMPATARAEKRADGIDRASLPVELLANHFMAARPRLAGNILLPMPELDKTDWAALKDAYGSARWVPTFIRALTSSDRDDREWAAEALHASVIHQGHTDPASLPATKALVELVGDPLLPDPAIVLYLLARLAIGEVRWCFEDGVDFGDWPKTECFDAVLDGVETYLRLLLRPETIGLACFLLALLPAAAARSIEAVRPLAAQEQVAETKASLVLGCGILCRHQGTEPDESFLTGLVDPGNHQLVRLCAVAALAFAQGRNASQEVREVLREAADRAPPSPAWPWPWTDNFEWTLADLSNALWESVVVPDQRAARDAVRELFPSHHQELWLPAALSNEQCRVLVRWLSEDWYWPPKGHPVAGLPNDRVLLARVVRQEPHVLLDREVEPTDGSGLPWPIWRLAIERARERIDENEALRRIATVITPRTMPNLSDEILALLGQLVRTANGGLVANDEPQVAALVSLAASLLGRAGAEGLAYARQDAEKILSTHAAGYARRLRDAVALARYSGEPLDARFEPLLVISPPAATYPALLREAIAALPPERRRALVRDLDLYGFSEFSEDTPRGRIHLRFFVSKEKLWPLLDLVPEPWMAEKVLDARAAYEHHMATEATREERAFAGGLDDHPFPEERALKLLALVGAAARPALERLAAEGSIAMGGFLDEARRRTESKN